MFYFVIKFNCLILFNKFIFYFKISVVVMDSNNSLKITTIVHHKITVTKCVAFLMIKKQGSHIY